MSSLVFFHGLNTFGDDEMHLGPVRFGPMHGPLEREFRRRDIDFIPVTGLGADSAARLAERALPFLEQAGVLAANKTVHILGHSIGGLVARALSADRRMKNRVRTLISVGTPHAGARVADFGMDLHRTHPRLQRALRLVGYDTQERSEIFRHYTEESAREFNSRFPIDPGIKEVSLICECEQKSLSLPLRLLSANARAGSEPIPGDGFVSSMCQRRGLEIGPFALDHLGETGFFFQPGRKQRERARAEFSRLVDTVVELISDGV